jgi:hypothetical protein
MNSGFYPQVVSPHLRVQTISNSSQKPFYFGGSSVPISLDLNNNQFSGSGFKPTTTIIEGDEKGYKKKNNAKTIF